MDKRVSRILDQIKTSCLNIFSKDLVGIYIHGSLAFDCFTWEKSDIDFIVVVKASPSLHQKEQFIRELLGINKEALTKGLEMSVVLQNDTLHFVYPTPFELHFSNAHMEACLKDLSHYCDRMHGVDPDLAAHFTIIREVGMTLYGEDKHNVFGIVPKDDYLNSIMSDLKDVYETINEDPIYYILNLCRILAYTKADMILSKRTGGEWAIKWVTGTYIQIIEDAIDGYVNGKTYRHPGKQVLSDFITYMLREINKKSFH